jgi:hypothetical protein
VKMWLCLPCEVLTMNIDILLKEAEALRRDCYFLKATGNGEPVGLWFESDDDYEEVSGLRRWLTLRADALPNAKAPPTVYFSIYTGDNLSGCLNLTDGWPPARGTLLYAHPASVIPPIDAIFSLGSKLVSTWLKQLGWKRKDRPGRNFPGWNLIEEYQDIWMRQHPVFHDAQDIYAITGGWHMPTQWHDWHRLTKSKLLVTTVRDSEPWVEAFQMPNGSYKVIQRST